MTDVRWRFVAAWGLGLGLLTGIITIWLANVYGYISTISAAVVSAIYGTVAIVLIGYAFGHSDE